MYSKMGVASIYLILCVILSTYLFIIQIML